MKIQDILFAIIFLGLLIRHKENWFLSLGLLCFLIAIPFFYFWIFFTAERLVWYGVLLILVEAILKLFKLLHEKD
jgi:hypothetical protein